MLILYLKQALREVLVNIYNLMDEKENNTPPSTLPK